MFEFGIWFGIGLQTVCTELNGGLDDEMNWFACQFAIGENWFGYETFGLVASKFGLDFGGFGLPLVCHIQTMQTMANQLGKFGYSCPPMSLDSGLTGATGTKAGCREVTNIGPGPPDRSTSSSGSLSRATGRARADRPLSVVTVPGSSKHWRMRAAVPVK